MAGFGSWGPDCQFGEHIVVEGCPANIHLGRGVRIGTGARLVCTDERAEIRLGDGTNVHAGAVIDTGPGGSVVMGRSNSINPFSVVYGHGGLVTGDYVRIAAHTVIIPANHVFTDTAVPIAKQGLTKQGIRIGDDVWIGTGVRVLDGVEIGSGSVVGAGSVVTRSFPPGAICVGVPARMVKNRFAASETDSPGPAT